MAMIDGDRDELADDDVPVVRPELREPDQKSPLSGVSSIGGTVGSSARNMV